MFYKILNTIGFGIGYIMGLIAKPFILLYCKAKGISIKEFILNR